MLCVFIISVSSLIFLSTVVDFTYTIERICHAHFEKGEAKVSDGSIHFVRFAYNTIGILEFNYRAAERGQIVMYMTSMTVVRETFERCKSARNILHTHMVPYEQRDVYLSHDNQRQLRERMDSAHEVPLPQIFIDGLHLGGATELEKLNESGELRKILHRFPKIQVRGQCDACGGFRYVPCGVCHGSKKSLYRNHFTEEFSALRCTSCNENGLQKCPHCLHHAE